MVGELAIDYGHRRVTVGGEAVDLSATEYELLRVLSLDAGRVVTFETLLRRVWAKSDRDGANLVRNCVRNLRRRLGDSASTGPRLQRAQRRLPHGQAAPPNPTCAGRSRSGSGVRPAPPAGHSSTAYSPCGPSGPFLIFVTRTSGFARIGHSAFDDLFLMTTTRWPRRQRQAGVSARPSAASSPRQRPTKGTLPTAMRSSRSAQRWPARVEPQLSGTSIVVGPLV